MFSGHLDQQAAAFNAVADRYDDLYPHKSGQIIATQWLIDRLPPGARVLDLGCGTGRPTAEMLAEVGLDVVGIDVFTTMLGQARRHLPAGTFLQMDALDLDGSLGVFDAAAAFFSLSMLPRAVIPGVLRRLRSLLRPGAALVIGMVDGDLDHIPQRLLGQQVRLTAYPQADLIATARGAGLYVMEVDVEDYEPATCDAPAERHLYLYCCTPLTAASTPTDQARRGPLT